MENLGEYLQKKREEQHISIEELVARTRIPLRFVQAIEADQFDLLPNQVTAKGFLRNYAECVGVDPAVVAENFLEKKRSDKLYPHSENQEQILSYVQVEKLARIPFPRRIVWSVVGAVVLLLVLVGLLSKKSKNVDVFTPMPAQRGPVPQSPPQTLKKQKLSGFSEDPSRSEALSKTGALTENNPGIALESEVVLSHDAAKTTGLETGVSQNKVVSDQGSSADNVVVPPNVSTSSSSEVSETETSVVSTLRPETQGYVLILKATEASWVQVKIDDDQVREALLQPNDTVQWKANKKFFLTLGNAGGIQAQLNGQDLGPFGPSGVVVRKEIVGDVVIPH